MQDGSVIKIIAILSLLTLYIVDALTWQINHTFTIFIVSVIAGLAGYEVGKYAPQKEKSR